MNTALKIAIISSPYTAYQLAQKVGKNPTWLSKVVNEYGSIGDAEKAKLAEILQVPVVDLFDNN